MPQAHRGTLPRMGWSMLSRWRRTLAHTAWCTRSPGLHGEWQVPGRSGADVTGHHAETNPHAQKLCQLLVHSIVKGLEDLSLCYDSCTITLADQLAWMLLGDVLYISKQIQYAHRDTGTVLYSVPGEENDVFSVNHTIDCLTLIRLGCGRQQ